jgi:hypothetical protein
MPATVRGLYRPRRKRVLATGLPKVIGSHPFTQGLVAFYTPGTSVSADLLKTHRATTVSSVPPVIDSPGLIGSFANSSGAYLEVLDAADLQLATNFTILLRIKITDSAGCIITKGSSAVSDGVGIRTEASNLYVTAGASNVLGLFNPSIPYTGAWIDLALVSTGTGSALYINGVSKATGSSLSSWFNSSTVLRIGAPTFSFFGSGSTSTQMLVASVAFYNRGLSASELQARYLNPYGFLTWPADRRHYLVGVTGAGAQNLSPSLFTNTSTFFSPTVGRGAVNLTPSLFTNTSTFFAPTVSGVYTLTPALFTNPNTFFSPTVTSTYNLTPSLFTNNSTFFSATVTNAGNLSPSLFTNTNTFFSPTVGRGVVNLAPTLFANSNIFYSPTVALAQPQALLPSLYTNPNTFFLPVVRSHIVLVNVYVKLLAPHVFSANEYPTDTIFGPDQSTVPPDFQYTPLMEGLSGDSISAIAQTNIDVFGRYDAHGNLLDNPPIPRPIYDPQPTPAVGDKHFLPLGNGSWP